MFEPPDGGVAENVLQLARHLPAHGWEPWVAGPAESIIHPELARLGVPVARLPLRRGFGRPLEDARALRAALALLRRRRFDVVHVHSAKAGVVGRLAAAATRHRALYSPHCFPFVGPWGAPRRVFATTAERALAPLADVIVCVAEQERRVALEQRVAAAGRLAVVRNGVAVCPEDAEVDPELDGFARDGPLAGSISVLRPQKAVDVFVAAAPRVLARVPDARLAVIGDGDMLPALRAQAAALGLPRERFRFFGFRPPAARALRALDVFVLSSAWEALPISILEALACGVPQVATDVGGTAEAVRDGETGLLCPPGDPEALADRLVELLSDPPRREAMAAASRARHAEAFRVEEMARRTAALYDRVAGGWTNEPSGAGRVPCNHSAPAVSS